MTNRLTFASLHPAELLWVYRLLTAGRAWAVCDPRCTDGLADDFRAFHRFIDNVRLLDDLLIQSDDPPTAPFRCSAQTPEGVFAWAAEAHLLTKEAAQQTPVELAQALANLEASLSQTPTLDALFNKPLLSNLKRLQALYALTDLETQLLAFATLVSEPRRHAVYAVLRCFNFEADYSIAPAVFACAAGMSFETARNLFYADSPLTQFLLRRNSTGYGHDFSARLGCGEFLPLSVLMDRPLYDDEATCGLFSPTDLTLLPAAGASAAVDVPSRERALWLTQSIHNAVADNTCGFNLLFRNRSELRLILRHLTSSGLHAYSPTPSDIVRQNDEVSYPHNEMQVLRFSQAILRNRRDAFLVVATADDLFLKNVRQWAGHSMIGNRGEILSCLKTNPTPTLWYSDPRTPTALIDLIADGFAYVGTP